MKRSLERVAAVASRLPTFRRRMAGRTLVLAYHNVTPPNTEPSGELAAQVSWQRFLEHLDVIEANARVVTLGQAVQPDSSAHDDRRPSVVITFDDAYAGAIEFAIPELRRRRLPCSIFVAPAFLDGSPFWWDAIAQGLSGVITQELRRVFLIECRGEAERVRHWAKTNGYRWSEPADAARACSQETLSHVARSEWVEIGHHSWSHPNFAMLSATEISEQFQRANDFFLAHTIQSSPHFAYPYGSFTSETDRSVRDLGFGVRLRVDGGWLPDGADTSRPLERLNVPSGLSAAGLELRLRGLLA